MALDDELVDPSSGPFSQVVQQQQFHRLLGELQRLPELSRAALLMYAVDGMSYEQIAEVLRLSLPAVKVKIHRARLLLTPITHEN